jgi:flagellar biosynthetic protein FlhB
MPEEQEEKTEEPTWRKIQKARDEGEYAQSKEVPTVLAFFAVVGLLHFYGPTLLDQLKELIAKYLEFSNHLDITVSTITYFMSAVFIDVLRLMAPVFICVFAAGVAGNVLQIGFHINGKCLTLKMDKLNPVSGVKRLFSLNSVVEGIKSVVKLGIVTWVAYLNFRKVLGELPFLVTQSIPVQIGYLFKVILKISFYVALLMVFFAFLDWWYQQWQYRKKLRMTKKETKDERKETEGDPQIKGRQRSIQLQEAMKRMMQEVPKAEVVITNPTEFAIALAYDRKKHRAPIVVAKGRRFLAQRIRELAEEHNVPIVENKLVAQALYRMVKLGMEIPIEFYKAVAEILAFVYRVKNKVRQWRSGMAPAAKGARVR